MQKTGVLKCIFRVIRKAGPLHNSNLCVERIDLYHILLPVLECSFFSAYLKANLKVLS